MLIIIIIFLQLLSWSNGKGHDKYLRLSLIISSPEKIIIVLFYRWRDLDTEDLLSKLMEELIFQPSSAGSLWSTPLFHSTSKGHVLSGADNIKASFFNFPEWRCWNRVVVLRTIPVSFVSSVVKDMKYLGAGMRSLVTSGKAVLRTENKKYVYEGKGDQENESDSKCQITSVATTTMEIATNWGIL